MSESSILSSGKTIEPIIFLRNILLNERYRFICKFPLRKYKLTSYSFLLNEIGVLREYLNNGNNLFSISINPDFYINASHDHRLKLLRSLFFLNEPALKEIWNNVFTNKFIKELSRINFFTIEEDSDQLRSSLRIVPFADLFLLTSPFDRTRSDFTYLSYDSLYFASFIDRRLRCLSFRGDKMLDMCCGVGIQALMGSRFCRRALGVDINPRALHLARLNAAVNGICSSEFQTGNLFEDIGGRYDLILSNPPFIFADRQFHAELDSYGGEPFGLGVTLKIVESIPDFLSHNGRAFIITRSPVVDNRDFLFTCLPELLPLNAFNCLYHHVSDSVMTPTDFEIASGVQKYRQVILEISRGSGMQYRPHSFMRRNCSLF